MSNLYIIGTPIGNLKDITLRALEVLKKADFIACEDTRVTKRLLDHFEINKPLISFHQHSKVQKIEEIVAKLQQGERVALVTDAGTPGVSDPGGKLVEAAVEAGISVVPIPGVSAITAALSVAGIPTDKFLFLGFLPHKKGREKVFKKIAAALVPVVFYESVHRIEKALVQLDEFVPEKKVIVCRELTKKFEHVYRGRAKQVLEQLMADKVKGEFVVIVD